MYVQLIFLLCLVGCGYNFPGQVGVLPGGVEKIYIPLFVNQTAEPLLENKLTNLVSEVFTRNHKIGQIENRELADAILQGTIINYRSGALSYDRNDAIGEYRATMTVAVALLDTDTKSPLWEKEISWSSIYHAADDKIAQEDFEQQAIEEISRHLAEEILYQLLDDF
ncbi:MAG: LptE family protein [Desulfuromonadales bacterium]|nr:LptE family protein [Desulfuromonadales bacterium]